MGSLQLKGESDTHHANVADPTLGPSIYAVSRTTVKVVAFPLPVVGFQVLANALESADLGVYTSTILKQLTTVKVK